MSTQDVRSRTWRVKDQSILPMYGFPYLSTAPVFSLEFACGGVISVNGRGAAVRQLTELAKSQTDSTTLWFNLNTDAVPSFFLATNNPRSDNPSSAILVLDEPFRLRDRAGLLEREVLI